MHFKFFKITCTLCAHGLKCLERFCPGARVTPDMVLGNQTPVLWSSSSALYRCAEHSYFPHKVYKHCRLNCSVTAATLQVWLTPLRQGWLYSFPDMNNQHSALSFQKAHRGGRVGGLGEMKSRTLSFIMPCTS